MTTSTIIHPAYLWAWLAHRSPIVIARRSTLRVWERNGFELGRDYERGRVKAIRERVERLEAQVDELTA